MPAPRNNVSLLGEQPLFEYHAVQGPVAPGQVAVKLHILTTVVLSVLSCSVYNTDSNY